MSTILNDQEKKRTEKLLKIQNFKFTIPLATLLRIFLKSIHGFGLVNLVYTV